MKALLDAMGGDNGPETFVEAARRFLRRHPEAEIAIAGPEADLRAAVGGTRVRGLTIVDCSEVVTPGDEPVRAIRQKKDSSMVRGLTALRNADADFLVSAGNTGALMSGAVILVGRIPGFDRPGLSSVIPTLDHRDLVMLDLGAGVDIKPRTLVQYAIMGSVYARTVMGKPRPRVGLLNIGTEPSKGDRLRREAFPLLREWDGGEDASFTGNIEARDLLGGGFDVVVTDGFTGNMVLKAFEGTGDAFRELTRRGIRSGWFSRFGGMFAGSALKREFRRYAYQAYGGAMLLGVLRPVIKCHGNASAPAIASALEVGFRAVEGDVTGLIENALEEVPNGDDTRNA